MANRILFYLPLLLFICLGLQVNGQQLISIDIAPKWDETLFLPQENSPAVLYIQFANADRWQADPAFPVYRIYQNLAGNSIATVHLIHDQWEAWPGSADLPFDVNRVPANPKPEIWVTRDKNTFTASGYLLPLRNNNGTLERLVQGTLHISYTPIPNPVVTLRGGGTEESVLANGTAYKIAVSGEGIYKLNYDFLKNNLKLPVDQIDPRRIHLYGNGGAMLPRINSADRADDLTENAIYISGESDGVFNPTDYILFYAAGPNPRKHDLPNNKLTREIHLYDLKSYYFLKVEAIEGLRIPNEPSLDETNSVVVSSYNTVQRLEDEQVNLLDDFISAQGSGTRWFGDKMSSALTSIDYSNRFDFSDFVPGSVIQVNGTFVSRSDASNRFTLKVGGSTFQTGNISATALGEVESTYAFNGTIGGSFTPASIPSTVELSYTATGSNASGWVDFLEFNFRKQLKSGNTPVFFTDLENVGAEKATYVLSNTSSNSVIWNITNPLLPKAHSFALNGTDARFTASATNLEQFVVFDLTKPFPAPEFIKTVEPQNLHGILETDMVIVYPREFEEEAKRLAEHRRSFSNLSVSLAEVEMIYNEFSSGSKDPFAIRDFARMLYQRDSNFHYLLLLGDASFDTRNIKNQAVSGDFVPVFETDESLNPINAFPTDDLFGLMDDTEGGQLTGQSIDIAIGRLPVETLEEATQVVDKIIRYDISPETFGDWKLRSVFMSDDEDSNLHLNDADALAESVQNWVPDLNLDKVFLDAYKQVITPGGQRYPDANKAFNNAMFKGSLLVNYLGHGGTSGWTQERVLHTDDIQGWSNTNKLPLFITATCTFAAFDNPGVKSGGELVLLNPMGGGIALFSTVRPVYASQNKDLASRALQELFADTKPWEQPMGEILRRAKNKRGNGLNDRKFLLLGDPAQFLAYPRLRVVATKLNGKVIPEISTGPVDTIKALQTVTITGRIEDLDGNPVTDFNGVLYPTVFDKAVQAKTLGNDPKSYAREFRLQKNILYKGAATIVNGEFTFTFTIPQDIIFNVGEGKFSFYAWDQGTRDAAGSFEDFIIFGIDAQVPNDNTAPVVDVFMNGPDWAFGGLTSDRPILYVELFDDNGFNISGSSIGHDPLGILNEDTQKTFALNDFFEPVVDDFRKGVIRYPLDKLQPGRYSMRVRAWDIFNNPGEGYTEFVVGNLEDGALAHLLNYPNPVTDWTYFRFEHNLAGQTLKIDIDIYDMTGRLAKRISEELYASSNRISTIGWDGLDQNGSPLPHGLYLYKVRLRALDGLRKGQEVESNLEKLVLLK
jgi:hypothetical protein